MKKINIQLASFLGLILLITSFYTPILAPLIKLNTTTIFRLINSYLIAYLAYMISFMDTKKVLLLFLPLLTFTIINLFIVNGFTPKLNKDLAKDIYINIRNFYDLIGLVGIFFLIEFLSNRIFGNTFTSILGILCLGIFFYYDYSKFLRSIVNYKDIFLYFSVYVMALRVRTANKINPILYILAIVLLIGEVYIDKRFSLSYGYPISFLAIIYLVLKQIRNPQELTFEKFMIFVYIYIFPSVYLALNSFVDTGTDIILILSGLITFFIGQILFYFKIKFINYILVGIN